MVGVPEEVLRHYADVDEGARITSGLRQLELLRTQHLIRRFLPDGPLDVADIGGATGISHSWRVRSVFTQAPVSESPGIDSLADLIKGIAVMIDAGAFEWSSGRGIGTKT